MVGDHIVTESRDARSVRWSVGETAPIVLRSDEPWPQWHGKGARHGARVARNKWLIAAIALAIGVIWGSVSLLGAIPRSV